MLTYTSNAHRGKLRTALGLATIAAVCALPSHALAAGSGGVGTGGGTTTEPPTGTTTAGSKAKLKNGFAIPPANAPRKVVRAIDAANEIVKGKPYCLGGGHQRRKDDCYDCSGSVSYALTGAGLLDAAMPSGSFSTWGKRGRGAWITTYSNSGHIYAVIAGLRLDTSMTVGDGPGWSTEMRSGAGYLKRHPIGL